MVAVLLGMVSLFGPHLPHQNCLSSRSLSYSHQICWPMCFLKENFRGRAESNISNHKVSGGKTEMLKDVRVSHCHLSRR